jgi:hypothetical protein
MGKGEEPVKLAISLLAVAIFAMPLRASIARNDTVTAGTVDAYLAAMCEGREIVGEDWDALSEGMQAFALRYLAVCLDTELVEPTYARLIQVQAYMAHDARMVHLHPELYGLPNDYPGTILAWPECFEDYSACWIAFYDSEAMESGRIAYTVISNEWMGE